MWEEGKEKKVGSKGSKVVSEDKKWGKHHKKRNKS